MEAQGPQRRDNGPGGSRALAPEFTPRMKGVGPATDVGGNGAAAAETVASITHAVQGGVDALIDVSRHEVIRMLQELILKDIETSYDDFMEDKNGAKVTYNLALTLTYRTEDRPVGLDMRMTRASGAGGHLQDVRSPKRRQADVRPQSSPRTHVAGIPVENFDRMHKGRVHRPEKGTAARPSASNLEPWLQTPNSWGLRYNVDLQHGIGAMSDYRPTEDVASLRGGTMVPAGTDASWQIRLDRIGKGYTPRIGVVNTNMRVRDDWYREREASSWYMTTGGDTYQDVTPRGHTGKAAAPGDVIGVHLMWDFDGLGILRFTMNGRSLKGEITGVKAPCHVAVQLLNKGDLVTLVKEELRAMGANYVTAPSPPPWTGHHPGSGSRPQSAKSGAGRDVAEADPVKEEARRLRSELGAVQAQKQALVALLREGLAGDASSVASAASLRGTPSSRGQYVPRTPIGQRSGRPASASSSLDRGGGGIEARIRALEEGKGGAWKSSTLPTQPGGSGMHGSGMHARPHTPKGSPPARYHLETGPNRALLPYRWGKPDPEDEILCDESTIFGGGWVPGVTSRKQRLARAQAVPHVREEHGRKHARMAPTDERSEAVQLVRQGGIGKAPPHGGERGEYSRGGAGSPAARRGAAPSRPMSARQRMQEGVLAAASAGAAEECHVMLAMVSSNEERARLGEAAIRVSAAEGHRDAVVSLAEMWGGEGGQGLGGGLLAAAQAGHWEICEALLDLGCSTEHCQENTDRATPLILAACHGQTHVVEGLIQRGALIDAVDKDGYSALMWACFKGREEVASLLMDMGANVSLSSNHGNTPLIYAAYANSAPICRLLLQKEASAAASNAKGMTAADVARQQGHEGLLTVLEGGG